MYKKLYILLATAIMLSVTAALCFAKSNSWQNRKGNTRPRTDSSQIIVYNDSSTSSIMQTISSTPDRDEVVRSSIPESSGDSYIVVDVDIAHSISSQPITTDTVTTVDMDISTEPELAVNTDDIILLAKLINHEASLSWNGRVYVGSVVINRMNYFGTSLYDTIAMPNQFIHPSYLGNYTDEDYDAAEYVLTNGSVDPNVFYFTGCHSDHLNWFEDINHNWIGAY